MLSLNYNHKLFFVFTSNEYKLDCFNNKKSFLIKVNNLIKLLYNRKQITNLNDCLVQISL